MCLGVYHQQLILPGFSDGGGIRGYGSLLILQELMVEIGKIEQSLDYPDIHREIHTSSFAPCPKPLAFTARGTGLDGAYVNEYLPCHYFGRPLELPKR